ncbi:MAG: fimT [Gammaproteobacteria bacterium]|jgi:type IV fimbrial biogenesis protein FimT|nr:fimT [Gammaproteobacteria bacterium]
MKLLNLGFSLSESLIVIALIAITSSFAAHSLSHSLQKERQFTRLHELAQVILYAKNYAISHKQNIKLCPSQNHTTCQEDWSQGAILLANKTLLLSLPALATGHQLKLQAFPSSNDLQFNPLGMLNCNNGKFIYSTANGETRSLLISKTGRIRFSDS